MKILFTLLYLPETDISKANGMYIDLAKECVKNGHEVTLIGSSLEQTRMTKEGKMTILRVKSGKIVGEPNLIKKGIAMAMIPKHFKKAYNKYLKGSKWDWIVMPTPPITLVDFVAKVKKESGAKLYMILRDIHPQSSWSLGEIRYRWMYNYLDRRSRKGYELSDVVGCMSQRNIDYILEEYPTLNSSKMKILYNWLEPSKHYQPNSNIRKKYNLENKVIALFGGNIALGQRIENIADLAIRYKHNDNIMFVIIGKGVMKQKLIELTLGQGLTNVLFLDYMPQEEYLNFIRNADIGLISINENNAVPTCPSKLASYMSLKIPVLAMINRNNDYGKMIDDAHAGFWAVGSDREKVYSNFEKLVTSRQLREEMGKSGYEFFIANMTTDIAANTMLRQMNEIDAY